MDSPKVNEALGVAYQIPRNSLALLMIAQIVVVLPYFMQLSPWIIAVGLFCGYWRMGVYQGRWDYPRRWIKALLVIASFAGVAVSGVSAYSLEAAASVLILAFALKLIEMKGRRDAYLVIFLGYFIIATQFLFDQSILVAVYELLATIMVTAAMVGMNQLHTRVRPLASLRLAGSLVVQALPFAIVLFLFFPRIAPLWTVPLPMGATTGISDHMTPGDIAELTQSDELAFRVVFQGPVPANKDLYWRGLVYSNFESGTWSLGPQFKPSRPELDESYLGTEIRYEVLLEPTMSNWLFALDTAIADSPNVLRTLDYRLVTDDPVMSVFRYDVVSRPGLLMDDRLIPVIRVREKKLPEGDNPRIRAFAESLFIESGNDVGTFIEAVLRHIRQELYSYTLQPPTLPREHSIDEFWFDTRAGFCTHYAGAFVFMLRSVGIPTRMVGGYQGGEINPISNHLVVRQYDAHAWAEVWMAGRGWTRVDPTAAVAPERIELGLNAALSLTDRAALSLFTSVRMGDWELLGGFLDWTDSLEHRWNLWVIGYDTRFQAGFLTDLLGELTPTRIGLAMLSGGSLSVGLVAILLFWRRRPVHRHPVERLIRRFGDRLAGFGYPRLPSEPPGSFIRRVAEEAGLEATQVNNVVAELNTLLYNPSTTRSGMEIRQLRSQLRRLQFRLAFSLSH
ncbi:MAG: DUF3488 and transglutaminase-like domain-containing protein [Gammaproteobacteria bacterium]|nr:DUF3488 and transglutaminase-like domain-containing protein [Gammaproteobacteria bacterium]